MFMGNFIRRFDIKTDRHVDEANSEIFQLTFANFFLIDFLR